MYNVTVGGSKMGFFALLFCSCYYSTDFDSRKWRSYLNF